MRWLGSKLLSVLLAPFKLIGALIAMIVFALGWAKGEKEEGE